MGLGHNSCTHTKHSQISSGISLSHFVGSWIKLGGREPKGIL